MQRAAKIGGGDSAWKLSEVLRSKLAGGMIGRGGESWKRPGEIAPFVDLVELAGAQDRVDDGGAPAGIWMADEEEVFPGDGARPDAIFHGVGVDVDRKSTRLNSSHRCISYAVFCLKKKSTRL